MKPLYSSAIDHWSEIDWCTSFQPAFVTLEVFQQWDAMASEQQFAVGHPRSGPFWPLTKKLSAGTTGETPICCRFLAIPPAAEPLAGFASLEVKRGDTERALVLLLIFLNHPASFQETRSHAEHVRIELETQLTRQLTRQHVEAAQARVEASTFEAVVDDILKQANLT